MKIRPGPGKLAVTQLDLSQEIELADETTGKKFTLFVASSDNSEGLAARVIANCKPYVYADEGVTRTYEPEYPVGSIVIIGKWSGTKLKIDRESFIILREEDVLCALGDEPSFIGGAGADEEELDADDHEGDELAASEITGGTPS